MRFSLIKILATLVLLQASQNIILAQETQQAWPGPKGIFLFLGNKIATGDSLSAYLVERLDANNNPVKVEEVKLPATFQQFMDKVNQSKTLFPSQPLPAQAKLEQLYNRARATGIADSLSGWKNYPVRMALGVMCHDPKALKGTYTYRISELNKSGEVITSTTTNQVLMPHIKVFDSIRVAESSRTGKLNYIKWHSVGKNPAPMFQPFRFEDGKTVSVSGWTGKTAVNDTSYYTFTDSVPGPVKAEQYFIVPFDPFGNAGASSEILKLSFDHFSRAKISKMKAGRIPDKYGIRISWFCNAPGQVGKITLLRSEAKDQGFAEYARIPSGDTVYHDINTWPGHTYYYYLKAYDTTGKRFFTSDKVWFKTELPSKPGVPQVTAKAIQGGVELTITMSDSKADGVRIFRNNGINESMSVIGDLIPLKGEQAIKYADTSENLSGRHFYTYQVRCETNGSGVSNLSEKVTARPLKTTLPADPAFVRGSVTDNKISILWQDVHQNDTSINSYLVSRREITPDGNNSPMVKGKVPENTIPVKLNTWTDSLIKPGNVYSYAIQSQGRDRLLSPGDTRLLISLIPKGPIPPDFIKAEHSNVNKPTVIINWADVMYEGFTQIKLYRQINRDEPTLVATLRPGTTRYVDIVNVGLDLYSYFIITVHSSGTESWPSEKVEAVKELISR